MNNNKATCRLAVWLLAVSVSYSAVQPVYALSGGDLVSVCTDKEDKTREALCVGYLTGVSETLTRVLQTSGICAPDGITLDTLITTVVDYINKHPHKRQDSAVSLVWSALVDHWPCPGMKTPSQ